MGEDSDREFVVRAARIAVVGGLALVVLLALLWVLKGALTPLAVAFVVAYLLDPIIDRFEAGRVPRSLAIFLLLGLTGAVVAGGVLIVVPRLQKEVVALGERMPGYLDHLSTVVIPDLERRIGIDLPHTLDEVVAGLRAGEVSLPLDSTGTLLAGALASVTGTLSALVGLFVIPILAYYLLVEFDALIARLGRWVPPRHRDYVFEKARTVDRLISSFLRGQLLVAATLGVLYAIGFGVIGIDLAIGVGLLAGALALVPYLGNVVAVALASALCILEFGIDWHLLAVLGWYAVCQNLEGFVLTPRIVGGSVGLHPALVIVALLIGGDLFGFLGLLIAVPAAAVAKVFVEELLELYRGSRLFAEEGAADARDE